MERNTWSVSPESNWDLQGHNLTCTSCTPLTQNLVLPEGIEPSSPVYQTGILNQWTKVACLAENRGIEPQDLSASLGLANQPNPRLDYFPLATKLKVIVCTLHRVFGDVGPLPVLEESNLAFHKYGLKDVFTNSIRLSFGGGYRGRTDDLLRAKQLLSQLS